MGPSSAPPLLAVAAPVAPELGFSVKAVAHDGLRCLDGRLAVRCFLRRQQMAPTTQSKNTAPPMIAGKTQPGAPASVEPDCQSDVSCACTAWDAVGDRVAWPRSNVLAVGEKVGQSTSVSLESESTQTMSPITVHRQIIRNLAGQLGVHGVHSVALRKAIPSVQLIVGERVGSAVVGEDVGLVVGCCVGAEVVGERVGSADVGDEVGLLVVGAEVGSEVVGLAVGETVGIDVVGEPVGAVGDTVGKAVGDAVPLRNRVTNPWYPPDV